MLIEYEALNEELEVKRGKVIFPSPHKTEVYKKLMEIGGGKVAIEYAGEVPRELAVLFRVSRWRDTVFTASETFLLSGQRFLESKG